MAPRTEGREYWKAHQVERRLSPAHLVELAEGHLVRDEALLRQANRYLFTDTNAMTMAIFARYYHGDVSPRLAALARQADTCYDLVLVCDTTSRTRTPWTVRAKPTAKRTL